MPEYNFPNSPRYQRALQKLTRFSPEQRAIISPALIDSVFTDEEMRNRAKSMIAAANKEDRDARLALSKKALKHGIGMANRKLALDESSASWMQGQENIGNMIGLGNVAASGIIGLKKADYIRDMTALLKKRQGEMFPQPGLGGGIDMLYG